MNISFDFLPENSRIWIYPSNRVFSDIELEMLKADLSKFLSNWTAHNRSLDAAFDIPYKRFIVIGINQNSAQASGCSIDASVRFIKGLEQKYDIVLLDKMNVTFKQGKFLTHKSLDEFVKMAKAKSVSKETIVFNNLVNTVADYKRFWEVPACESWHRRFLQ